MKRLLGSFCLVLCCSCVLMAQSKEQLEKERLKIIKEIEATSRFLSTTLKDKEKTLSDVKAITSLVDSRKKLIDNIKAELIKSDQSIQFNSYKLDSLHTIKKSLEKQYDDLLSYNYRQELSNNKWTYLLSSNNINTFLMRWRYLAQFQAFQKQKEADIAALNEVINLQNIKITDEKKSKASLLTVEQSTMQKLEVDKKNKDVILKKISSKEGELLADLKKKQSEREKLNIEIEKVIMEQLKNARKAAEAAAAAEAAKIAAANKTNNNETNAPKKTTTSPNKEIKLNTETEKLASDFAKNKKKLPWPVGEGFISSRYGTQAHPTLAGVTIENNGIDISSSSSQSVSTVFDGVVAAVSPIQGSKNMVIIRHGSYYTVYSNLETVSVTPEMKLRTGQKIGTTGLSDGVSELHFELWNGKSKQNPTSWLSNR